MSASQSALTICGTRFDIFADREHGFGVDRISHAIDKAWPLFYKQFGMQLPDVKIHDIEAPIGGGPQALFEVGIYSAAHVDESVASYIEKALGWKPQKSTSAYIQNHYSRFEDPVQGYVDDMITHELGHLFFGWGVTKAKAFTYEDAWFALAMGIVYDRIVWNQLYSESSPLFESVENLWRHRFATIEAIDQRLIAPDITNDETYGLNRIQTYGHGKAAVFLGALRKAIGEKEFDQRIRDYLQRSMSNSIIYDEFISMFDQASRKTIAHVEAEYRIR